MSNTPLIDELVKGPWPSFIKDIKRTAEKNEMCKDLLNLLEMSYRDKKTHWKHGGIVGVRGYGGGIIGRYSDSPELYPGVSHFHTVRINQPAGWFYSTSALRYICDLWEKHGSGLTNLHGSTGDMVMLGTTTEHLEDIFTDLSEHGWDLGGSGSDMRTPSCCLGKSRCEFACIDTMAICHDLTNEWQDELHRPAFPYKFKIKIAGCPNDCVASIARSDCSIIGTWRDNIRQDDAAVAKYASGELVYGARADGKVDIKADVVDKCPTGCMSYEGGKLSIDNKNCNRCMHCINLMPQALRVGVDGGATILLGAKAPIVQGALLSSVLVPFIKMDPPYEEFKELIGRIWEFWDENGEARERIGEMIVRIGKGNFVEEVGCDPIPEMICEPRSNPYIFYEEYFEEE
ncbi:MAG: dissimilatory-type sulfite reductase subunit alpha [Nitrospirae bacterium]|nr:dissimilatory-type sulfite reductase subunit alpha [Nitrospirota bacterium]MBI5694579.1 dissimilatory-type sulfite reductase subunit alpha [Nitrospirota bacterium]